MQHRSLLTGHLSLAAILAVLVASGSAGCAVDDAGLSSRTDASFPDGGGGSGGHSGSAGHGGTAGTGGAIALGGSGGHLGGGGSTGSSGGGSGAAGSGSVGHGGVMGTGGRAGAGGLGGPPGMGGRGGSPSVCGPGSCPNGCCDGNVCVTTHSNGRCGRAGAACAPCASCYQCGSSGTCELNAMSTWTISCMGAAVTASKPGGGTWDAFSPAMPGATLPDPFCEFQINEVGRRDSMVLTDTLSPSWGEPITPPNVRVTSNWLMSQAGMWSILVADYDGMNNEEICQVFPTLTPANFSSGTVVFSNNRACTRLSIQLSCDE